MGCKCGRVEAAAASSISRNDATTQGAAAEASVLTAGARRDSYGPPEENHKRTALMWSSYLAARGYPRALSAEDVCWLNILQKASRDMHAPSSDTLVDGHGYLNNIEEIRRRT
jgi:hypothetical protein